MKLIEIDESMIHPDARKGKGKWQMLVTEFANSDMSVAEVQDIDSASSAYRCLRYAIESLKIPVVVSMRAGHIYLMRKN